MRISSPKLTALVYPILVFAGGLSLYVRTMPPSISTAGYATDTLVFQYTGKVLGTPHFGYPTYMFLNILASRLPFWNLAYRINLLSAVFAAATLFLLYFIILSFVRNRPLAAVCALLFAVTFTFWENSIIAEVYSLNALFMCATLLFMLKWEETKRPFHFYLACFFFAFSFGNHMLGVVMLPALIYWMFVVDSAILLKKKTYLLIALFIVGSMLQYSYVMIRTYQVPPQEHVFQFWPYCEGFGATHIEARAKNLFELVDQATGSGYRGTIGVFSFSELLHERIPKFMRIFRLQYSLPGLILAVAGMISAFFFRRKRFIFLFLFLVADIGLALDWNLPDVAVHIIPAMFILAIFISLNWKFFETSLFLRRQRIALAGKTAYIGILLGLLVFLIISHYPKIDRSRDRWLSEMMDTILLNVPDDTMIFTNHVYATAFWYKLYGEEIRPGARILAYPEWEFFPQDIAYAFEHYKNVYLFFDKGYWPIFKRLGIKCSEQTLSRCRLETRLSEFPPGKLIAACAEIETPDAARTVASCLRLPHVRYDRLSFVGILESQGTIKPLTVSPGPLLFSKGARLGDLVLPADISIVPGEDIRVNSVSCSRFKKKNNFVVLDQRNGRIDATMDVDWEHSAAIDPAHLLKVESVTNKNPSQHAEATSGAPNTEK